MRAVVVSFFESKNIGDKVLSHELVEQYKKVVDVIPCSIFCNFNINVGTNIEERKSVNQVVRKVMRKIFPQITKLLFWKNYSKIICDSDLLIIGGGNMLMSLTNSYDDRFKQFVSLAKEHKKFVFATCLGVGPFFALEHYNAAIETLKICDYITVRDTKSYNLVVKGLGSSDNVYETIDPAFIVQSHKNTNNRINHILVNVINAKLFCGAKYEQIIGYYIELIQRLYDAFKVNIILFSTEANDNCAILDILNKLNAGMHVGKLHIDDYSRLSELYLRSSILIGARMHSLILAYNMNLPTIGLAWQSKVEEFFKLTNNVKNCFPIGDYQNIKDIIGAVKHISMNIEEQKKCDYDNLYRLQKKFSVNFDILDKIADLRKGEESDKL